MAPCLQDVCRRSDNKFAVNKYWQINGRHDDAPVRRYRWHRNILLWRRIRGTLDRVCHREVDRDSGREGGENVESRYHVVI